MSRSGGAKGLDDAGNRQAGPACERGSRLFRGEFSASLGTARHRHAREPNPFRQLDAPDPLRDGCPAQFAGDRNAQAARDRRARPLRRASGGVLPDLGKAGAQGADDRQVAAGSPRGSRSCDMDDQGGRRHPFGGDTGGSQPADARSVARTDLPAQEIAWHRPRMSASARRGAGTFPPSFRAAKPSRGLVLFLAR